MISILHLISFINNGGAERYIISLIEGLKDKDCVFYIGVSKKVNSTFEKKIEELGVKIVLLPMKNFYDIVAAKRIADFCESNKIDVIHTHFLRENCVAILSKLFKNNTAIINTCHMNWKNKKSVQILNKIFTRFNKNIIAVSHCVKQRLLEEKVSKNKIESIYNGVDYTYLSKEIKSSLRKEFDIGEDVIIISTIARFNHEKGHKYLLNIIKGLDKKEPNLKEKIKFILVGEGELLDEIKTLVVENNIQDYVIFTGARKDIKNILYASNIYISPSENEALGISILEAMACGVPIIATNVGGVNEIFKFGIEFGYLIEYGNEDDAQNKLLYMIENILDVKEKFSKNAQKVVRDNFNFENMCKETYNLYKRQ